MKRKTHYEWRIEYYRDGDGSACDLDWADSLSGLRVSTLKGYGHPNDDGVTEGWNIALVKRLFTCERGDGTKLDDWDFDSEDFYYLQSIGKELRFNANEGEPPKRFKAQLDKLNKELA